MLRWSDWKSARAPGAAHGPATMADAADEARVRAGFWRKIASVATRVPFADDATAAYYCALDSRTPTRVRALLFGALAYFLLPTDALPDVFAGIGFTDDAAVLATALNLLASHITPTHREAARAALAGLRADAPGPEPRPDDAATHGAR